MAETASPDRTRPIGEAARALGVHPRTLMAWERIGLVSPSRRSNRRVYTDAELVWLDCARDLNRRGGLGRKGLATLLRFAPCWAVRSEVEAGEDPPGADPPARCRTCPVHSPIREAR